MAPENRLQEPIDLELRSLIETLYKIITQIGKHAGDQTTAALEREVSQLITRFTTILRLAPHAGGGSTSTSATTTTTTTTTTLIPPDVIEYVQEGRNPDIYTREFVEFAMRNNQRLSGKMAGFAAFRDVFAREIAGGVPQLRGDVERVVVHTGGKVDGSIGPMTTLGAGTSAEGTTSAAADSVAVGGIVGPAVALEDANAVVKNEAGDAGMAIKVEDG